MTDTNLTRRTGIVSLFTGAGGLDLGLVPLKLSANVCVDNDHDSVATLNSNKEFANTVILESDIRELSSEYILEKANLCSNDVAAIIGGPPCQSFSKAGYWTSTGEEARRRGTSASTASTVSGTPREVGKDSRTSLLKEYARILAEISPASFVFENVASITHPTNRLYFEAFLHDCQSLGYSIQVSKVNAAAFGVPQSRQRIIVAGILGTQPPLPLEPSHGDSPGLLAPVTAGAAISQFDRADLNEEDEIVTGRYAQHLHEIPPGSNYKALTEWAGHPSPSFVAETRFWNFLLKLHPDRTSWTIAANPGPWVGPFHWNSRRLRVPELAALQSFPTDYVFSGTKRSIRKQIGNAVPPPLASAALRTVVEPLFGVTFEH